MTSLDQAMKIRGTRRAGGTSIGRTVAAGLTAGTVIALTAAVGITAMFARRWIVADILTLAHAVMAGTVLIAGMSIGRQAGGTGVAGRLAQAGIAGAIAGLLAALLALAVAEADIRWIFVALSRPLVPILTLKLGLPDGGVALIAAGSLLGMAGAGIVALPATLRRMVVVILAVVFGVGLFHELIQLIMGRIGPLQDIRAALFTTGGLSPAGALAVAAIAFLATVAHRCLAGTVRERLSQFPEVRRRRIGLAGRTVLVLLVLALPLLVGDLLGQIFVMVALFTLMGFGLNIEVGYAGLLDLGFVAFFAVGAYTTALLTGHNPHALAAWTFWEALPVAVGMAVLVGVLFGTPVLKVRGDYLAVATLGLGEIVRVLVLSDMAKPLLGGAQGLLDVPRPEIGGWKLSSPVEMFYLAVAACALVYLISLRLRDSRLGRAWMSIRDDEDVARALGVDPVSGKLLAYGIGAGFSGIAGAIFAALLGSIFPHSFQLQISISILALLIVGGVGSLWGVVIGAVLLIGVPEVLREFGEFRSLFYGLAIVTMMRLRPQGLVPATFAVRRRAVAAKAEETGAAHLPPPAMLPAMPRAQTGAALPPADILRLQGVRKTYGGLTAIQNLNMTVARGSIHAVIGPNGAGKTTLFNAITGFAPATAGRIVFDGRPIERLAPERIAAAGISRTYQNIRIFGGMTVLDNVLTGMHLHTRSPWWSAVLNTPRARAEEAEAIERAYGILRYLGLEQSAHLPAASLSYGQQRKLEIGRALATRPRLLLLDEPLAGMNLRESTAMSDVIRELRDGFDLTVLLIDHQMRVVMNLSDRITVLDHGARLCEGTAEDIRTDPAVIAAYLGTANLQQA